MTHSSSPVSPPRLPFPRMDWHVHATFYRLQDAREEGRIETMVGRAAELGMDTMGIGEHLNPHPKHPLDCYLALARDLRAIAPSLPIPVFLGVEADVLDDSGALSIPDDLRARAGVDYVIASVHELSDCVSLDEYLERHQRLTLGAVAARNGADVLGHPWGGVGALVRRGVIPEWRFEMVPEAMTTELVDALRGSTMAVEINYRSEAMFADAAYCAFVARVRDAGIPVSVGSDAHTLDRLTSAPAINDFIAGMGFPDRQVWRPAGARAICGVAERGE